MVAACGWFMAVWCRKRNVNKQGSGLDGRPPCGASKSVQERKSRFREGHHAPACQKQAGACRPLSLKTFGHFAIYLIAPRPVKTCDGGVLGCLKRFQGIGMALGNGTQKNQENSGLPGQRTRLLLPEQPAAHLPAGAQAHLLRGRMGVVQVNDVNRAGAVANGQPSPVG